MTLTSLQRDQENAAKALILKKEENDQNVLKYYSQLTSHPQLGADPRSPVTRMRTVHAVTP